jgi:outer membrane protein assembly factor BamB
VFVRPRGGGRSGTENAERARVSRVAITLAVVALAGLAQARAPRALYQLRRDACPHGFGASLALDGDVLVAGGAGRREDDCRRVEVLDAATGAQRAVLGSPDAGDRFGAVVAVGGDTIAVSAEGTCTVHVFDRTGRPRTVIGGFPEPDECFMDELAVANGEIAVGVSGGGVFFFDAATGATLRTVTFGGDFSSMAVAGRTVFLGSPFGDDVGRVYVATKASPPFHRTIRPPNPTHAPAFGWAMAVDRSRLAVGSWHDAEGRESVGLWDVRGGRPRRVFHSPRRRSSFGSALAIRGRRLLVGAQDAARAFLYSTTTGRRLVSYRVTAGGRAGAAVALGRGIAVLGAPDDDAGSVTVFRAPVE